MENIEITNKISKLLEKSIDSSLCKIHDENPGLSKQKIVEILLQENPENKDEILKVVAKTVIMQKEN
jgi:hypothetical protein